VRINDQDRSLVPDPDTEVPDLEAKLVGLQTPRGWGLLLIRNMVDEMHITSDEVHHTVCRADHAPGRRRRCRLNNWRRTCAKSPAWP
jgi:hypothetical protein